MRYYSFIIALGGMKDTNKDKGKTRKDTALLAYTEEYIKSTNEISSPPRQRLFLLLFVYAS